MSDFPAHAPVSVSAACLSPVSTGRRSPSPAQKYTPIPKIPKYRNTPPKPDERADTRVPVRSLSVTVSTGLQIPLPHLSPAQKYTPIPKIPNTEIPKPHALIACSLDCYSAQVLLFL
ncbi:hypothetical protein DFH09DRAFT_1331184 [Mycena vulgaris]|nr:hypothetical protein DFH09DRAFT_1331184 [Mycena vulgaris]